MQFESADLDFAHVGHSCYLLHQPQAAGVEVAWATALMLGLALVVERLICPPVAPLEVQLDDGGLQQCVTEPVTPQDVESGTTSITRGVGHIVL